MRITRRRVGGATGSLRPPTRTSASSDREPGPPAATPGGVVAAVPKVLGFVPCESTVVVALGGDRITVAVCLALDGGEDAVSRTMQELLTVADAVSMVVYTARRPLPQ